MISRPPGWTWEQRARGILLRPTTRPEGAEIWYRERMRPLARVSELVAAAPRVRGWEEHGRSPIERFVSDEGEHAAQVTLQGALRGTPAVRTFAFVFGDDFVARVAGLARSLEDAPRVLETVRQLARGDSHLLGVRRRRYVYTAPESPWHGVPLPPFHALWIPFEFPDDPTTIAVFPALPGTAEQVLDVLLSEGPEGARDRLEPPLNIVAKEGLSGFWYTLADDGHTWDLVLHADDRYVYPLTLTTIPARRARHLPVFTTMAHSVEPVPRPLSTRMPVGPNSLSYWTE